MDKNKNDIYIDEGIDIADFSIFEIDMINDVWKVTDSINSTFGIDSDFQWNFNNFTDFILEENRQEIRLFFRDIIMNRNNEYSTQFPIKRANDGAIRWIASKGRLFTNEDNIVYRIIGTHIDITEYKEIEVETANENVFLDTLIHAIPDFLFVKEYKGRDVGVFVACNEAMEEVLGIKEEELIGLTEYDINSEKDAEAYIRSNKIVLETRKPKETISTRTDENGRKGYFEVLEVPYFDSENNPEGVIGIGREITDRVLLEQEQEALKKKAEEYAYMDYMTKTLNRNYLNAHFGEVKSKFSQVESYLVIADINHFKRINDQHGHSIGDEVLSEIGTSINELTKDEDLGIRYGGDEFVICLYNVTEKVVTNFIEELRNDININCKGNMTLAMAINYNIEIAVGYAQISPDCSLEKVLSAADIRMYTNKRKMKFMDVE